MRPYASAGPSRSGIPKYKQQETTNKNQIPKGKRPPSIEKISRVSLASTRNTPSKFLTPVQNNKYLVVPSTNSKRQSSDTVRSSFGGKSKKEIFPIGDAAFKTQCIDKLIEFFTNHHYDQPYDRNMLKGASGKDFASMFSFIYRSIDSSYKMPLRFEDDLPRLLKALKYPVQMSRSSFLNVGSPHSWPSVLAMLAWLIDVVAFYDCFDSEYVAFLKDFDDSIDLNEKRLNLLISDYLEDGKNKEKYQEEYKGFLFEVGGLSANDLMMLQGEEKRLIEEIERISDTKSQVVILQQQYNQLSEDKEKLCNFIQELKTHITIKDNERVQRNMELEEIEGEARQVLHHIEKLQYIKSQQNMNASELKKFKSHSAEVLTAINHRQNEEKELQEQVYASQMDISKSQQNMSNAVCKYNSLCGHLHLETCEITPSNYEDSQNFVVDILPQLKQEKRKVKELTFDTQNLFKAEKANKDKVEEEDQEIQKDILKLEKKMKRLEEETAALRDEMIIEDQQLQEKCDKLNEEVSQARRVPKSILYEKQQELEETKREFEQLSLMDHERRISGKNFTIQCYQHLINFFQERDQINDQHPVAMVESETEHMEEILTILQNCNESS